MDRPLSTLIGLSICSPGASGQPPEHIATLNEVVLDPRSGEVVAFRLRQGFIFKRYLYVLPSGVRRWTSEGIEVNRDELIGDPTSVKLLPQKLHSAFPWLGLPVRTVSGFYLGRVDDVHLNLTHLHVAKIDVARRFLGVVPVMNALISAERISVVTRRGIVVYDDLAEEEGKFSLLRGLRVEPEPRAMPADSNA